jgi:hypothetical protein
MRRTFTALSGLLVLGLIPVGASAHHKPGHTQGGGQQGPLSITARPNPIVYGGSTVISGRLTGQKNGGQTISLRSDPYPFAALGNVATTTTASNGNYSLTQKPLVNTRFQVRQGGTDSGVILVGVRIRTGLSVSDRTPGRGEVVRFSGRACPEHDGALVRIQKLTRRGWVTVRRTRLRDAPRCSVYSRGVPVYRDGTYRATVRGDADHLSGISRRRSLDVG